MDGEALLENVIADTKKPVKLDCTLGGKELYGIPATWRESQKFETMAKVEGQLDNFKHAAVLLCRKLTDEKGKRLFTDRHIDKLMDLPSEIFGELVINYNEKTGQSVEAAKKP